MFPIREQESTPLPPYGGRDYLKVGEALPNTPLGMGYEWITLSVSLGGIGGSPQLKDPRDPAVL